MVNIAKFEKITSSNTYSEKYILNQVEYSLLFFDNQLKVCYKKKNSSKSGKFKNFVKRILSKETLTKECLLESTHSILQLNNISIDSKIEYINDENIIYTNLYTGIEMNYCLKNEKLECTFILNDNCVIKDIDISIDKKFTPTLDEGNNVIIKDDYFDIIIAKPICKNKKIYFSLNNNIIKVNIKEEINISDNLSNSTEETLNILGTVDEENLDDLNKENNLFVKVIPHDAEIYSVEYRKLLIPVKKTKFKYPYSKSVALLCYPNFPVIENLYTDTEIKYSSSPVEGVCTDQNVIGLIEYKEVLLTPLISYSLALFNFQLDVDGNPIQDILEVSSLYEISQLDNVDIYALQNDSFEGQSFNLCQHLNDIPFKSVDFLIDLEIVSGITDSFLIYPMAYPIDEVEDYYLYEVEVKVSVYDAPPIVIPPSQPKTQEALNKALGRAEDSTQPFTPGELESITNLDFSNDNTLDTSILRYTPNLTYLDISSCNLDDLDTFYLQTLNSLETLIISNNDITNLEIIKNLKSLKLLNISGNNITDLSFLDQLVDLIALNASSLPSVFTSKINTLSLISGNKIVDVSPLANLVNLECLNLSGNLIVDVAPLANLINLTSLDISQNAIYDISPLSILTELTEFSAQGQLVNLDPILPLIDNTFTLDLNFLKDLDSTTPCIDYISNGGDCTGDDSCECVSALWQNILIDTEVEVEFSHDIFINNISDFSGTIRVLLKHLTVD